MFDEKKLRLAAHYGTGSLSRAASPVFQKLPMRTEEARQLVAAFRQQYPAFSTAARIAFAVTPGTWLIVLRRDTWLTLMLQVDDGREVLTEYLGVPILVSDIEPEFLICAI